MTPASATLRTAMVAYPRGHRSPECSRAEPGCRCDFSDPLFGCEDLKARLDAITDIRIPVANLPDAQLGHPHLVREVSRSRSVNELSSFTPRASLNCLLHTARD